MTNKKIRKKQTFAEILKRYPELAEILLDSGMRCIGCPMAQKETLEQGALMHGINPDKLVEMLNNKIDSKKIKKK